MSEMAISHSAPRIYFSLLISHVLIVNLILINYILFHTLHLCCSNNQSTFVIIIILIFFFLNRDLLTRDYYYQDSACMADDKILEEGSFRSAANCGTKRDLYFFGLRLQRERRKYTPPPSRRA